MWLAQILARCPTLLQFLHSTFAATLQSFSVWTVLPHLLHLPWKNASAFSFFDEALFGRWFLAWLLFCASLVFLFTVYAFSLLCSSQCCDPALGFLSDELPGDANPVSPELLTELWEPAVGDEDHGHDVVQVALVRDVQDPVIVLDH